MPLYDYLCGKCGDRQEVLTHGDKLPFCCGEVMTRQFSTVAIRDSRSLTGNRHELYLDRIDDIHKRQEDRGERLRMPHPSVVL